MRADQNAPVLAPDCVDCVLYDLGLPDAAGLAGLDELRDAAHGAAVVVLTGDADVSTAVAALRAPPPGALALE